MNVDTQERQAAGIQKQQVPTVLGSLASVELLQQRGHYLYNALHRTSSVPPRNFILVWVTSVQDLEEMLPDVH